jgi:hypothetical protein
VDATGINVGDIFSGVFTYDTSKDGTEIGSIKTYLNSPLFISASINNFNWTNESPASAFIDIYNDDSTYGDFFNYYGVNVNSNYSMGNGHILVSLGDTTGSVFTSTSLPTSFDLSEFNAGVGVFDFATYPSLKIHRSGPEGDRYTMIGQITSISPVPEPSTLFLLGSGLLGLVGYGRKRMTK